MGLFLRVSVECSLNYFIFMHILQNERKCVSEKGRRSGGCENPSEQLNLTFRKQNGGETLHLIPPPDTIILTCLNLKELCHLKPFVY